MDIVVRKTDRGDRYFLNGDDYFHRVYKYGFKSEQSLRNAYGWFLDNGQDYVKAMQRAEVRILSKIPEDW